MKNHVDYGLSARAGSLDDETLRSLVLLHAFDDIRDDALSKLAGQKLARSALRRDILLRMTIEFASGRLHRIAYYKTVCAPLASPSKIASELHEIVSYKFAVFMEDSADRRALVVCPSQLLVDWYREAIPDLAARVRQIGNGPA